MVIRIGTMFMGEVDAVGSQSIQTKFFVLQGESEIDPAARGDAYTYARYAAIDDSAWKSALEPIWTNVVA